MAAASGGAYPLAAVSSPPSLNARGLSPAVTLGVFPRALLCPFLWAKAPSDHVLTGFGGTGEIRDLQTPELELLAAWEIHVSTPFRRVWGGVHLDILEPLLALRGLVRVVGCPQGAAGSLSGGDSCPLLSRTT